MAADPRVYLHDILDAIAGVREVRQSVMPISTPIESGDP